MNIHRIPQIQITRNQEQQPTRNFDGLTQKPKQNLKSKHERSIH